jgi:hypothetical protein
MNTNPAGNTQITHAEESSESGQFERFEALMSGLVKVPKQDTPKQHETIAGSR